MKIIELEAGTFTSYGSEEKPVQHFPLGLYEGGYFISKGSSKEEQQALEGTIEDLRERYCKTAEAGSASKPKNVIPGVTDTPNRETMNAIMGEISTACKKLGADSNLLSIVGSFGDTLPDKEVLFYLIGQNRVG